MKNKRLYIGLLSFAIILAIFGFSLLIQILPIIIFIVPLFYIRKIIELFKPHKKSEQLYSESIFQKRLKRFKSIKRGYYSLIVLVVLYVMSLIGPLWMNSSPIVLYFANGKYDEGEEFTDLNKNGKYDEAESFTDVANGKWDVGEGFNDLNKNGKYDEVSDKDKELFNCYIESEYNKILLTESDFDEKTIAYLNSLQRNGGQFKFETYVENLQKNGEKIEFETYIDTPNGKYDKGEEFTDLNKNGKYDEEGEKFVDEHSYYFPAIKSFFSFIPGIEERYEGVLFNQAGATNFSLLNKELKETNPDNYSIMPLYPFHPHDDLNEELDDKFIDKNGNGVWDKGEKLTYDYNENGEWDKNPYPTKPNRLNIAGTEESGRDVFARLIDGYRISMTFAIIVSTLGYIIGIMIGACLGYFGGRLDLFGLRLIEIFSSIPFLFVLMILASFMKPGIFLLAFLSVVLKGWIGITMYIRGEFFREKPKDYVSAAVSMGQSNWKIMFKHILPNSLTPIITFAPFAIIADIGTLVSLDFLGYGLQQPTSSWGHLLNQGTTNIDNYHLLLFPIIALTLTIFMITFISEAIREAFDPRVYSRLR